MNDAPACLLRSLRATLLCASGLMALGTAAAVTLSNTPLFLQPVPGNLLLPLSVEWPTASTPAYLSTVPYDSTTGYYGYFDPDKCYVYNYISSAPQTSYFSAYGAATSRACASTAAVALWSGNYLNWASTQTLDAFRKALTGGNRRYAADDTATLTILEKTYHLGEGANVRYPNKVLSTGVGSATPFMWSSATTRIWGAGTRMWISGLSVATLDAATPPAGLVAYTGQSDAAGTASNTAVYEVYIRVKACDNTGGWRESNCVAYNSAYKPEGLLQQNAMRLRYSAFGYMTDSSPVRDGGVMRARMKYIGPTKPVPGSTPIPNSAAEWDASTGIIFTNPDPSDALSTQANAYAQTGLNVNIANSGVLNYINKFGYGLGDPSRLPVLKSYDPVSELFYAGMRYFRNLGIAPSYSDLSMAASLINLQDWLDGFPVITTWDDPIVYSCQKNFMLGIGDVNTHKDANLYGSTIRTYEPAMPTEVSSDTTVNVKTSTDMVGQLEGLSNLGSYSSGRNNSYFIAGLAYDAHTKDIRADLPGVQTISTYWVDVLESQSYVSKNQFWLAAKYGGFTVPGGFDPYAASNSPSTLTQSMWSTNGSSIPTSIDLRPDNYFTGDEGSRMYSGLSKAFAKIVLESSAITSTAFSSTSLNEASGGNTSYAGNYDPASWSGSVSASTVSYAADGTPTLTAAWNAQALLDAKVPSTRKIVTCCKADGTALPFTYSALTTSGTLHSRTYLPSFGAVPGVATASQSASNFLDYLRGVRTNEQPTGPYRTRAHVLGDVVNSKVLAVGQPDAPYHDLSNPGYLAYRTGKASRTTVVYVGANDGMLHAFDGSTGSATAGQELFAYVPSFAYGTSTTAADSGLAALGNPDYQHRFYVDGSPQVFDIDFSRVNGATPTASGDWRSVLIGGLGKGGNGYFAIDVSDPSAWGNEAAVASKVLWEFTDPTMGYSFGDARVVKTAKYGWVVVLTSGFNNADGKGYFYFVNPMTGALLEKVATPAGTTAAPLDMAYLTAFIPDLTDYTATTLYAGDMQGNVWRVDLSGTTGVYAAPTLIATLTDSLGTPQPVSTAPRVMLDPSTSKRVVIVGTGRLLVDTEIASTQRQSVYAIVDGTASAFYTAATLPSPATFPISRSELNANTSLLTGIAASPPSAMGWYYDLGVDATTGIAERVTVMPAVNNGIVGVAVSKPDGQACSPSATSYVLAVNFTNGQTVLTTSSGAALLAASAWGAGLATDLSFKNVGGKLRLVAGRTSGTVSSLPGTFSSGGGMKRLNWRSVPVQN